MEAVPKSREGEAPAEPIRNLQLRGSAGASPSRETAKGLIHRKGYD
jgi:hypothetical protein